LYLTIQIIFFLIVSMESVI